MYSQVQMKTIKTDTHLLLVDETAEIKEGDYALQFNDIGTEPKEIFKVEYHIPPECFVRKIIAASPKLEGIPEFETLPPNKKVKSIEDADFTMKFPLKYNESDDAIEASDGEYIAELSSCKGDLLFLIEAANEKYQKEYILPPNTEDDVLNEFLNRMYPFQEDTVEEHKDLIHLQRKMITIGFNLAKSETMFNLED